MEWTMDWWALRYVDPCTDCAVLTTLDIPQRLPRGGLFPSVRDLDPLASATMREIITGFRCARTP
jgi:hypothetical protein